MESFDMVKDNYLNSRETQKKELSAFLERQINKTYPSQLYVTKGGRGRSNYTSGTRITSYNLSNWKWVEVKEIGKGAKQSFVCVISFNMIDIDTASGNTHALYDRIGLIFTYAKDGCYYENRITTDIDLPLTAENQLKLWGLLEEEFMRYQSNSFASKRLADQ